MKTEETLRESQEQPGKTNWDKVSVYGRLIISYYYRYNIPELYFNGAISEFTGKPLAEVELMPKNGNIHDIIFEHKNENPNEFSKVLDELLILSGGDRNSSAIHIRETIEEDFRYNKSWSDLSLDKLAGYALAGINLVNVEDIKSEIDAPDTSIYLS